MFIFNLYSYTFHAGDFPLGEAETSFGGANIFSMKEKHYSSTSIALTVLTVEPSCEWNLNRRRSHRGAKELTGLFCNVVIRILHIL